ncbi:MAG: hypothetical protein R6V03_06035 [Kiritimatiellia bacterium]
MARLINTEKDSAPGRQPGPSTVFVEGIPYSNSAAKFWCSLADEVAEDYPQCSLVELEAPAAAPLGREHLFPVTAFEKDLKDLLVHGFDEVLRRTIAEFEITGPPAWVHIRLLAEDSEILAGDLSVHCLDAEIFPFLLAWPLKWARLPEYLWNNEFVEAEFQAHDRARGLLYNFSLSIANMHLSEGLFRRTAALQSDVSEVPAETSGRRTR